MKICESAVRLDKPLSKKFVFKLAQTQEELEACFRLLHSEYVRLGFMEPNPSGMRITLHHVLPTTSVLMCRHGKRVVGTVSLIRESRLGFPMQRVFDLDEITRTGTNVAEVSALAIDSRYERMKSRIMMPLLKFLYEYAEYRFDTHHLVIAVHPRHIGFYEDVLSFRRLSCPSVAHYGFVNDAPAVGAHLDLEKAKEIFSRKYAGTPLEKNLYHYFTVTALPNGHFPHQRFETTTDSVMTPELIDYFFNQKTKTFSTLDHREIRLLHAVYDSLRYRRCLPPLPESTSNVPGRNPASRRYPVKCPARLRTGQIDCLSGHIALNIYECSEEVICAQSDRPLSIGLNGEIDVELGYGMNGFECCTLPVEIVRLGQHSSRAVMMRIRDADDEQRKSWLEFVRALGNASTPSAVAGASCSH